MLCNFRLVVVAAAVQLAAVIKGIHIHKKAHQEVQGAKEWKLLNQTVLFVIMQCISFHQKHKIMNVKYVECKDQTIVMAFIVMAVKHYHRLVIVVLLKDAIQIIAQQNVLIFGIIMMNALMAIWVNFKNKY